MSSSFGTPQIAGIPWYSRQNYRRILNVMADRDLLPVTYDQWLKKAEHVERQLQARGIGVVRVDIDPDTFTAWCVGRGLNIDAEARITFANEVAFAEITKPK